MTLDLKDRLYTSSEVAEILGVSLRSVYRYLEEGKLDADIKTATGRHRFSKKNILDFLKPQETDNVKNTFSSSEFNIDDNFEDLHNPQKNNVKTEAKKEDNFDDFGFDFDEEFFKSLEDSSKESDNTLTESKESPSMDLLSDDDELDKLLKEFEDENDSIKSNTPKKDISPSSDDEEFELDKILRSLEKGFEEEDKADFDFKDLTPKPNQDLKVEEVQPKKDSYFDFDLDFDFDFLEKEPEKISDSRAFKSQDVFQEETPIQKESLDSKSSDDFEDAEDNWLERFRRAAEKNTPKKEEVSQPKKDTFESFFEDSSDDLDVFFDSKSKTDTIGISSLASISDDVTDSETSSERQELFYVSDLTNLKEIAQTVDKVARKFDLDYAFTLNAGLSLHKPIAPFSIIHGYVNKEDIEIFEDYLKLTPCSEREASVCLITPESKEVFEDAHELHGLYVVSNVQLRSDLIDKGLDKLAREI